MSNDAVTADRKTTAGLVKGGRLLHTMIRVLDLEKSIDFYTRLLGMTLLRRKDYESGRFTLAFIGYGDESQNTAVELTHNWDQKEPYTIGSGFGHLAVGVPDIYGACEQLAKEGVCILHQYPRSEAALAAVNRDDVRVADRFELYACGVELANGFRELTDAVEQRRRFEAEMEEKQRVYGERYPIDEEFLEALALMPEASGVALGFDRLVMLATGAPSISQVLWTP